MGKKQWTGRLCLVRECLVRECFVRACLVRVLGAMAWCVAIVVPALAVPRVEAQMTVGFARPQEAYQTAITRADLRVMRRVLKMGESEFAALEELYAALNASLQDRAREIADKQLDVMAEMEALQTQRQRDPSVNDSEAWKKDRREREATFIADVRSLLTKEQDAQWDALQRELRRMRERGQGRLMGESTDLVQLVSEVAPAAIESPAMQDVLETYATQLDAAYAKRREIILKHKDTFAWDMKDIAGGRERYAEILATRVAIQELTLRTGPQIASLLAEKDAAAFDAAFMNAVYAPLMKPTYAEQIIRAAAATPDVPQSSREALDAELAEYDRQKFAHIRKLAKLEVLKQRDRLPMQLRGNMQQVTAEDGTVMSFMTDDGSDELLDEKSELAIVRKERVALDAATRKRMMALLSSEQRARAVEGIRPVITLGSTDDYSLLKFEEVDAR